MLRKTLVLVIALALGTSEAVRADRIIEQVESSFEIPLASANIPAGGVGDVSFKTCDKCVVQTRLLTPSTRFFVSGHEVAATAFVQTAADVRKKESAAPRSLLMLYVDKKTLQVNRAALFSPTR
jgi:hypothetical protein